MTFKADMTVTNRLTRAAWEHEQLSGELGNTVAVNVAACKSY